jgi:hypothetical protein
MDPDWKILKHYLFDHNEGSNIGGVVTFGAKDYGVPVVTLLEPSAYAGQWIRYKMRDDVYHGHAVTIVGYNDNVMYDWGGAGTQSNPLPDGIYSNTNDNNLDGKYDMRDWEIGALKVANSYGDVPNQNNEGFEWVLYCCLPTFVPDHRNEFFALTPKESNEPGVVLKLQVDCEKKDDFLFGCGYGLNANSVTYIGDPSYFTGYSRSGGPYHIQGTDANGNDILGPMEFLLDFNHFFSDVDFGKVFLVVDKVGTSNGIVNSYALVDYRWNEVFELPYELSNFTIGNQIVAGINYDLIPHENDIIYDLNLNSDMVSRFNPTVSHDATLAVSDGVQIDMYESEIHINQGSSLILGNDVTIQAKRGICKLVIDGDITVGSKVHFLAEGENQLYIQINNEQLSNIYFDGCSFENSALITYNNLSEITNSEFTGSAIFGFNGSYLISNCDFNSSITRFIGDGISRLEDPTISITDDCRFNNGISTAIEIDNYPNFRIQNCTISNFFNGISLYNSGFGRGYKLVADNVITENSSSGITSYRSYVDLLNNTIENNSIGIRSFDRSVMHIEGDSRFVTQIIKDNDSYELLASQGSFPQYFHWNLVQDDDNLADDPLVKYTGSAQLFDVRNNCWGLNFNPSTDLFPSGYIWNPIWYCFLGEGDGLYTETENIYLEAINKIDSGDYSSAKIDFKQIVLSDPNSTYAQAALKEIYSIEAFDENNYQDLKNYYETDSIIINTPELEKIADFLINFCEIKLENWPTAIDWFENEIINPESFEDSIFAIIDLGYTYFLMENSGLKSSYSGQFAEYVPTSRDQFEINRDYLLSLLPEDQLNKTQNGRLESFTAGEISQNIPNPFKGTTQIYYSIDFESDIQLDIYNDIGQLINTIVEENQPKGKHFIEFDGTGLNTGIYFYSIKINGSTSASKKMIIL